MAMLFREKNEVLWTGIRPAHKGAQIFSENNADNDIVIIETVTTGKTLFLCTAMMGFSGIAAGNASLYIRDDSDIRWGYIFLENIAAGDSGRSSVATFWPPLEIPEDYDIIIRSSAAGLEVNGTIFGWEE